MKRTHLTTALALALTLALPLGAHAADLDYSYIEAGYTRYDQDGGDEADGWTVGGSAAVTPYLHVFGNYTQAEFDEGNFDVKPWRLGLGWNTSVSEMNDLVVRGNYIEYSDSIFDADGWEAEVGLRSALTPNFESYLALGYSDIDVDGAGSEGDLYGKLGAQYKFNPTWGIAASLTFADGGKEYFVGPRVSF